MIFRIHDTISSPNGKLFSFDCSFSLCYPWMKRKHSSNKKGFRRPLSPDRRLAYIAPGKCVVAIFLQWDLFHFCPLSFFFKCLSCPFFYLQSEGKHSTWVFSSYLRHKEAVGEQDRMKASLVIQSFLAQVEPSCVSRSTTAFPGSSS